MYGLPSIVCVDKRMPKEGFYRNAEMTPAQKDEFVHGIAEIRFIAVIDQGRCGIPAANGIDSISVFNVALKGPELPRDALRAMVGAVPTKLLCVCTFEGRASPVLMRGKLREGAWMDEGELELVLTGQDLSQVWDNLCAQVVFGDTDGAQIDARMHNQVEVRDLKAQLRAIKKKLGKEKQIAKRNALSAERRAVKARLRELGEEC